MAGGTSPSDPLSVQFVELIRAELNRQDLSISDLARRLGLPQQNVSRTLTQPGTVTTKTMVRYFAVLGLTPVITIAVGAAQ